MRSVIDPALRRWLPLVSAVTFVALLLGVAVGRLTGPVTEPGAAADPGDEAAVAEDGHIHPVPGQTDAAGPAAAVTGQSMSASGYTLIPQAREFDAGDDTPLRFHIADSYGTPVTSFTEIHEAPMHLFVMRRDLSGYQHLHPTMDDDGTWTATPEWAASGPWRIITDFAVAEGDTTIPITLGVDVSVPGEYRAADLPPAEDVVRVDGFEVTMEFAPEVAVSSPLLLRVTRDGEPAELEPYLGAVGHLVVLRDGDLGFLHVHPDDGGGDALRFWTTIPSQGDYRAHFDFKVDGQVHTAGFTLSIP
ncbi:hypothetical protein LX16_2630 [Stackebrandtia albiflava]|uniref:Secreted protein n=1 Tax=Stackebrandtia albiflava TaxID=406432 RepID=A0A562V246_9ACTN|nr:hypothetical protein [Stackebrandtia albiflava]TWJ11892.1 hypothetical protein LX16_2630 [Stackebrandtia albiflava]